MKANPRGGGFGVSCVTYPINGPARDQKGGRHGPLV